MDSIGLLATLRAELAEASPPAVLLTGGAGRPGRAFELGAQIALRKPFQVEDLLRAVQAYRRTAKSDA
ncbi:MAG: hypothetical protein H5U40_14030 [Polyangiaceae bacterium]|nr:hypothetical protein [Polyangiaceae bacterium]